jgi:hypothetical protein
VKDHARQRLGLRRVERFALAGVLGLRVLAGLGGELDQVAPERDELAGQLLVFLGVLSFGLLHLGRKRFHDSLNPAVLSQ